MEKSEVTENSQILYGCNCSVPSQLRAKMHLNDKNTFGDGILACMSRDFDIFMSKHLAGQWLLNSYVWLFYIPVTLKNICNMQVLLWRMATSLCF